MWLSGGLGSAGLDLRVFSNLGHPVPFGDSFLLSVYVIDPVLALVRSTDNLVSPSFLQQDYPFLNKKAFLIF